MPIGLTAYIKPKNDAFTGIVQASQVLGGGGDGTLPDACLAESNVLQHEAALTLANQVGFSNVLLADGTVPLSADWDAGSGATNRLLTVGRLLVNRTPAATETVVDVQLSSVSKMSIKTIASNDYVAFAAYSLNFSATNAWACALLDGATATFYDATGTTNFTVSCTGNITLGSGTGIADLNSGVLSAVTKPAGDLVGTTATQTLTNKTLTAPTIGDFTNATHDHSDAAGGGTFAHDNLTSGTIAAHDTGATGAELDALTDGSDADSLHAHDTLASKNFAIAMALALG